MDAFTKLPDSVKAKYNLSYRYVFEDFVIQEIKEGGNCEEIIKDLNEAYYNLCDCSNDYYSHPFFTDSQAEIIEHYVDGAYAEALTKKTEREALDLIRSSDGLLCCMVALGDEEVNQQDAFKILKCAIRQVQEWQKEDESALEYPGR